MNDSQQKQLGSTLWSIADKLRGAMNADDFRDYMLSFLFLRYLSDHYEEAVKKELGIDYQKCEEEIKKNHDKIECYVEELKQEIIRYANTIPLKKLGLREEETNKEVIKKARNSFIEDNNEMLNSKNIIPLTVWYIHNLDQVEVLEKQMRRKIHYVIKPAYLWRSEEHTSELQSQR